MKKTVLLLILFSILFCGCLRQEKNTDNDVPEIKKTAISTEAQPIKNTECDPVQKITKQVLDTISLGKKYYVDEDYENAIKCFTQAKMICEENNLEGLRLNAVKWLNEIGDRKEEAILYAQLESERQEMLSRQKNKRIVDQINNVEVDYRSETLYWNPIDGYNLHRGIPQATYTETEISTTQQVTEQHGEMTRQGTTVNSTTMDYHNLGIRDSYTTVESENENITGEIGE